MATLKKYYPQSEAELHMIIQAELDAIEGGLELLQHEYPSGKGILDFLCADSDHRLVIIEVKLHEDENILFQALRYYGDIDKNRYVVARLFADKDVNPEDPPRIILIAERFSEDIRRLSTLVRPDIELLEYSVVTLPTGEKGILYHPVSPVPPPPPGPKPIEWLLNYLKEESLKPLLQEIRQAVKGIGKGIEEYATPNYIAYKHTSGRQFAYIWPRRRYFDFGANIVDEDRRLLDYEGIRIETGDEDYSEVLAKVKTSFVNLGGKLEG
ncbi:MAG: DUF91 domain-containing protein [Anaerolineales bacterium]|nr:MAG: DUF91 domain-containing protein [Anaerolineales bacterium]